MMSLPRVCVCMCMCEHHQLLLVFPQLGDYISDIASNMMLVEEHILWMAQNEARACTRIVQCVERIADLALTGDNQVISKVCVNRLPNCYHTHSGQTPNVRSS